MDKSSGTFLKVMVSTCGVGSEEVTVFPPPPQEINKNVMVRIKYFIKINIRKFTYKFNKETALKRAVFYI